jgi:hypothetical protein
LRRLAQGIANPAAWRPCLRHGQGKRLIGVRLDPERRRSSRTGWAGPWLENPLARLPVTGGQRVLFSGTPRYFVLLKLPRRDME